MGTYVYLIMYTPSLHMLGISKLVLDTLQNAEHIRQLLQPSAVTSNPGRQSPLQQMLDMKPFNYCNLVSFDSSSVQNHRHNKQ